MSGLREIFCTLVKISGVLNTDIHHSDIKNALVQTLTFFSAH